MTVWLMSRYRADMCLYMIIATLFLQLSVLTNKEFRRAEQRGKGREDMYLAGEGLPGR